jgi:hypothetical protein
MPGRFYYYLQSKRFTSRTTIWTEGSVTQRILANSRRNSMTNLNIQLPESLYKQIEALAAKENIAIEQLVAIALSAQVSAWMTKDYLEEKAKRGSWKKFQQVLNKVPNIEPEEYDNL